MKWKIRLAMAIVLACMGRAARAEDDISTIIDGFTTNNAGAAYYVGDTGTNNSLLIINTGILTNVTTSAIGNTANASSNSATITGSGSSWFSSGSFYVGNTGAVNALTIANGGYVQNGVSTVGAAAGADGNLATITGASSAWSGGEFNLGNAGANNTLTIADGAQVTDGTVYIGRATGANNNSAIVTGAGSVWYQPSGAKLKFGVRIGESGSGNSLTLRDGGRFRYGRDQGVSIGGAAGGNSNALIVAGTGSLFEFRGQPNGNFAVGSAGSFNTMTISDGGQAEAGKGWIGSGGGSSNTVRVAGAGSAWTIAQCLYIGNGSGNSLTIADGGAVFVGEQVGNASPGTYIGLSAGASGNSVTVTGIGSLLGHASVRRPLVIGSHAAAVDSAVNVYSGGAVTNLSTVTLGGINSALNLGDGVGVSAAMVQSVVLSVPDARLNFNSGLLKAEAAGPLVSGAGVVSNTGPAYISTDAASTISSAITGPGSLTKLGAGMLTLSGTNSYTGATIVSAGALELTQAQPGLGDESDVCLVSGVTLALNFDGIDRIGGLYFNGVAQPQGVYGAGAWGDGVLITGAGSLRVTKGPFTSGLTLIVR